MNEHDSIEEKYEEFRLEGLKKLEAEHGKEWIEKNKAKLQKDFEIFKAANLL